MTYLKTPLGSPRLPTTYPLTIVKEARHLLKLQLGNVIGFYLSEDNQTILLKSAQIESGMEGLKPRGSSTLTTSYAVTVTKQARELVKGEKGGRLVVYELANNSVSVES